MSILLSNSQYNRDKLNAYRRIQQLCDICGEGTTEGGREEYLSQFCSLDKYASHETITTIVNEIAGKEVRRPQLILVGSPDWAPPPACATQPETKDTLAWSSVDVGACDTAYTTEKSLNHFAPIGITCPGKFRLNTNGTKCPKIPLKWVTTVL